MINTKKSANSSNVVLIPASNLDIKIFISNNLTTMITWLTTDPACQEYHTFQDKIGIDSKQNIIINKVMSFAPTIYAIKRQRMLDQDNLSLKEWAIEILTNYAKWYNKQYAQQQTMSLKELATMLNKSTYNAVFDSNTYQNFIINKLDCLNSQQISYKYIYNYSLFFKQLLTKYQTYQHLNASTLSYLTKYLIRQNPTACTKILLQNIYDTLVLKKANMPKIVDDITDKTIDLYNVTISKLITKQLVNISPKVELPLSSIFIYDSIHCYCQVVYKCMSTQDINNLINKMINYVSDLQFHSYDGDAYHNAIQSNDVSIILGKYRSDLIDKITALRTSFNEITTFRQIATELQQLVDKANK